MSISIVIFQIWTFQVLSKFYLESNGVLVINFKETRLPAIYALLFLTKVLKL